MMWSNCFRIVVVEATGTVDSSVESTESAVVFGIIGVGRWVAMNMW